MSFERPPTDPGPAAPPPHERYQQAERLGEGAVFSVYAGRDTGSNRYVALYFLKPDYSRDGLFTERLRTEVRKVQRVQHPGIIQVYDIWGAGETMTIAAEPVRGIHLKERIRRVAPFPLAVAVDIAVSCAEALQAAAERGLAHGDLRPENIIVTPDGQVKVAGFGVGASLAASTRIQLAALPELAAYLAPERTQGAEPDTRADVYALGIILYEMLGGVTPFLAETPLAVAVKHLHEPPPPLRRHCPGVPRAVEGVVMKCLQKDPGARYPSMAALLEDLRTVREALRTGKSLDWTPALAGAPASAMPTAAGAPPAAPPPVRPAPPPAPIVLAPADTGEPSSRLLLLGCLGVVLTIAAAFLVPTIFLRPTADVSVPNLVGKTRLQAISALQAVGLKGQLSERPNEKVALGVVFLQEPEGHRAAKEGNVVRVFISSGPQPIAVPDVVGRQVKVAQELIRDAQLTPSTIQEEFNDTIPKGEVITQEPGGGSQVTRRAPVTLTVSKGAEPVPVPKKVEVDPLASGSEGLTEEEEKSRQWQVTVRVPAVPARAQNVRIVVIDEDGGEHEEFNEDQEAGTEISPVVQGYGAKGKVTMRVYINGRRVTDQKL